MANNVLRATLSTTPVAVCGTGNQAHVGVFRAVLRCYATAGTKVRLAWRFGEAPYTRLPYVTPPAADAFCEVDLGLVTIPRAQLGTQRWQAQVEAYSSTAGDAFDVDYLALLPAGEGYGKAAVSTVFDTPTVFSARDEFDQTAGNLHGKTMAVGGNWDTDDITTNADFAVETTGHTAQRTAVSDSVGRYALAGAGTFTNVLVQADAKITRTSAAATFAKLGLLARYTDPSNNLRVDFAEDSLVTGERTVVVSKVIAGTVTYLGEARFDRASAIFYTLRLVADTAGRWHVWAYQAGGISGPLLSGQDSALATGGTLATGRAGVADIQTTTTASTRNYDNFFAAVPTTDAAIFAGQSLEIRHNDTIREDSTGTYWGRPQSYRGSRFYLPAEGDDGLTSRVAVMARRNNIEETSEANVTDSTTVSVAYTPRWLVAPRAG